MKLRRCCTLRRRLAVTIIIIIIIININEGLAHSDQLTSARTHSHNSHEI